MRNLSCGRMAWIKALVSLVALAVCAVGVSGADGAVGARRPGPADLLGLRRRSGRLRQDRERRDDHQRRDDDGSGAHLHRHSRTEIGKAKTAPAVRKRTVPARDRALVAPGGVGSRAPTAAGPWRR